MTDYFQEEWLKNQEKKRLEKERQEEERTKQHKERLMKSNKILQQNHTHAPPKERKSLTADPADLFKMTKFKNIPPKIESKRNPDDPALIKYKQNIEV
ncbi:hypothetical protein ROZALSC1DRAFT_26702 [Rozella allomycis CSF55]|uniref:Uncharacterized protein n=1 Tax=Rozella allomycis (strain CSF55) TaxID=988480 RepID=A0A075AMS5_ROZAC|nr:hypothetical protein O9G_001454 [Rozella allomycis CSF55]RKP21907.1 hypothetical protein ROZALSC1DRAFT_26702 [Rozella allomycis CSF55]|eukprot:EPZ30981.1 hypothetical protein O9G_001454 [Rozella allomycis CSF55]